MVSLDALYSLSNLITASNWLSCKAIAFLNLFSGSSSAMMTSMLSLHILLVFVIAVQNTLKYEPFYYLIGIGAPLISTSVALYLGKLGNTPDGCAMLLVNSKFDVIGYWTYFYGYITFSILFGLLTIICFSYIMVFMDVQSPLRPQTKFRKRRMLVIRVIKKMVWYPFVPLITQGPQILQLFVWLGPTFMNVAVILNTLSGVLTSLIFLFDPAINLVLEDKRKELLNQYLLNQRKREKTNQNGNALYKMYFTFMYMVGRIFLLRERDLELLYKFQEENPTFEVDPEGQEGPTKKEVRFIDQNYSESVIQ
jgi:hypothetical protein